MNIFNFLIHMFGCSSSLIIFDQFNSNYIKNSKFSFWYIYSFVFGLLFIISYPIAMKKILLNAPLITTTSMLFQINILFYSFTFFITVSTYIFQFVHSRQFIEVQNISLLYYQKLHKINQHLNQKNQKNTKFSFHFNYLTLIRFIFTIIYFTISSLMKLIQIFL